MWLWEWLDGTVRVIISKVNLFYSESFLNASNQKEKGWKVFFFPSYAGKQQFGFVFFFLCFPPFFTLRKCGVN